MVKQFFVGLLVIDAVFGSLSVKSMESGPSRILHRISGQTKQKNSELLKAIEDGDPDKVRKAIESGANVNAKDKNGNRVLHLVLLLPTDMDKTKELLGVLLSHENIDVNAQNRKKRTPIFNALEVRNCYGMVEKLVDKKANVNAEDSEGVTPLCVALQEEQSKEVVKLLLTNGARVEGGRRLDEKNKPLNIALSKGNGKMVKLLNKYIHGNGAIEKQ